MVIHVWFDGDLMVWWNISNKQDIEKYHDGVLIGFNHNKWRLNGDLMGYNAMNVQCNGDMMVVDLEAIKHCMLERPFFTDDFLTDTS